MFRKVIRKEIEKIVPKGTKFVVEIPESLEHGDYASNVALVLAKKERKNPKEVAEDIKNQLLKKKFFNFPKSDFRKIIKKIDVAGAGFLNFFVSDEVIYTIRKKIHQEGKKFGGNTSNKNKNIIIEYTDPNPFKEFHIGHLMSNSIGESIARLIEFSGAKIKRVNYQGDVGLHVAKAIWGYQRRDPSVNEIQGILNLASGEYYVRGHEAYETDKLAHKEIQEINKKIYEQSDHAINEVYEKGKQASLYNFNNLYERLGTKFDKLFFESDGASYGVEIVKDGLKKGVFEQSDGAVVFRGEKYGLHTRVFLNSDGLPTYEAKELGLVLLKHKYFPYDRSIIITGNEIQDYFKVLLRAMEIIYPDFAAKTFHISHGMLRLSIGKMSSRSGNVVRTDEFIGEIIKKLRAQFGERLRDDKKHESIALGAIKYFILKQSPGRDIMFDFDKSISLEGDSGPYIQYMHARACSVLRKAKEEGILGVVNNVSTALNFSRFFINFPEVVARAQESYDPHYIAGYAHELAKQFSAFYEKQRIIDAGEATPDLVALTEEVAIVLKNSLSLLGIDSPEEM